MKLISKEIAQLRSSPIRDGFKRTEKQTLQVNNLSNVTKILDLMLQPFDNVLRYNEFSHKAEIVSKLPLVIGSFTIQNGQIDDDFINAFIVFADKQYNYQVRNDLALLAVSARAHANSYNPLTDYLHQALLDWDEQPRIDNFTHKYLGIDQTSLNSRLFKLWLVGAVAKAFDSKTKFDFVLILQGGQQGIGKTSFFQALAVRPEWYTDSFSDFKNKDNYAIMLGAWIINDDEMTASSNTSIQETKKFVTQQSLEYRAPYDRFSKKFDKSFVIGMTTNDPTPLKDQTGTRRFLVLQTHQENRQANLVETLKSHPQPLKDEIKQLWGEAVSLYQTNYSIFLSDSETKQVEKLAETYLSTDSVQETLEDIIGSVPIGEHYSIRQLISMILERLNQDNQKTYLAGKNDRQIRNEIKMIMAKQIDWQFSKAHNVQGYTKIRTSKTT